GHAQAHVPYLAAARLQADGHVRLALGGQEADDVLDVVLGAGLGGHDQPQAQDQGKQEAFHGAEVCPDRPERVQVRCWRHHSPRKTAVAAATLRLSTAPVPGMPRRMPAAPARAGSMPSPSAPIISSRRSGRAVPYSGWPPRTTVAAATKPAASSRTRLSSGRPRRTSGTCSAPPSATRAAAPDRPSDEPCGSSRPATPKCAEERRMAPRLCGLPTPSSHTASTGPAGRPRNQASRLRSAGGSAEKTTPSWCSLPESLRRSSASTTE